MNRTQRMRRLRGSIHEKDGEHEHREREEGHGGEDSSRPPAGVLDAEKRQGRQWNGEGGCRPGQSGKEPRLGLGVGTVRFFLFGAVAGHGRSRDERVRTEQPRDPDRKPDPKRYVQA